MAQNAGYFGPWIEFPDRLPCLNVIDPRTPIRAASTDVPLRSDGAQQPYNVIKAHGARCGDLHEVFTAPNEKARDSLIRFDREHGPGTVKKLLMAVVFLKSRAAFVVDIKEHGPAEGSHARSHVNTFKRRLCPELTRLIFENAAYDTAERLESAVLELAREDSALVFDWVTDKRYVVAFCAVVGAVSLVVGLVDGYRTHDVNKGLGAGFGTWTVVSAIWAILNQKLG